MKNPTKPVLYMLCGVISFFCVQNFCCACTPGDYQSFYYGIVYNVKNVHNADEIRAYIVIDTSDDVAQSVGESVTDTDEEETGEETEETVSTKEYELAGSTSDNPGSLRLIDGRADFGLYICHDSADNGTEIQLRYVRNNQEYQLQVITGTPALDGKIVEIVALPEDVIGNELVLKFINLPAGPQAAAEQLVGDVNNDGKVDAMDASIILNHSLFGDEFVDAYDLNEDQVIDNKDVIELYNIMLGNPSTDGGLNNKPDDPFENSPDNPLTGNSDDSSDSATDSPLNDQPEDPFNAGSDNPFNKNAESPFGNKPDSPLKNSVPDSPFEKSESTQNNTSQNIFPANKISF